MSGRRVAMRTCIACGLRAPKRELVRIVRAPSGVVVDPTGKMSGRGAYLCHEEPCWQAVTKGDRLSHALRGSISAEDKQRLLASRVQMAKTSADKEAS